MSRKSLYAKLGVLTLALSAVAVVLGSSPGARTKPWYPRSIPSPSSEGLPSPRRPHVPQVPVHQARPLTFVLSASQLPRQQPLGPELSPARWRAGASAPARCTLGA